MDKYDQDRAEEQECGTGKVIRLFKNRTRRVCRAHNASIKNHEIIYLRQYLDFRNTFFFHWQRFQRINMIKDQTETAQVQNREGSSVRRQILASLLEQHAQSYPNNHLFICNITHFSDQKGSNLSHRY